MPDFGGTGSQVMTFARTGQHMTQKTVTNKKSKAGLFDWEAL